MEQISFSSFTACTPKVKGRRRSLRKFGKKESENDGITQTSDILGFSSLESQKCNTFIYLGQSLHFNLHNYNIIKLTFNLFLSVYLGL